MTNGRRTTRDPSGLVPYDGSDPEHRAALRDAASRGVGALGGTEAVIAHLRERHGLDASRDIGFDGLCLAAEMDTGTTRRRSLSR